MVFDKKRWRVFGDWLKIKREEAKLSQDGLAYLVGVDRQTIYRLENALSGTKRETVIAIAKALNANEEEALRKAGFAPQEEIDSDIERVELETMYRKRKNLTGQRRDAFKRLLDMVDRELDKLNEEESRSESESQSAAS